MSENTITLFDVPKNVTRTLPEITASLDLHVKQAYDSFIGIGRDLDEARFYLGRGKWGEFVKEHTGMSLRSAENYIRLSREVPEGSYISTLPYTKALAMLSVPEEERENFAIANMIDQKSVAEIKNLTKQRDAALDDCMRLIKEKEALEKECDRRQGMVEQLMENPRVIKEAVYPEDYDELKLAARDAEEAVAAAEEAERRAADAEKELRRLRSQGADPYDRDPVLEAEKAAQAFMAAAGYLPFEYQLHAGSVQAQRLSVLEEGLRRWCDQMQEALSRARVDLFEEGAVS